MPTFVNTPGTYNGSLSINTNCIGFWPIAEGSGGTAHDISGGPIGNMTLFNESSYPGNWDNSAGPVYYFNKSSSITYGVTPAHNIPAPMTVSFWFNFQGNVLSGSGILSLDTATLNVFGFCLVMSNGIFLKMGDTNGNTQDHTITSSGWSAGTWHQLAITIDGSGNTVVYIDGAAASSFLSSVIPSSANAVSISPSDVNGGTLGPEYLACLQVWSRVLSSGEIASIYANPYLGAPGGGGGSTAATMFFD